MGNVLQLPVGKTRAAALKRLRAVDQPDAVQAEPVAKPFPSAAIKAHLARLGRGTANAGKATGSALGGFMVGTTRVLAGLVVGMVAVLLSWCHRPMMFLLALVGVALLAALAMNAANGWADPRFATQCAVALLVDLGLAVSLKRLLQSLFKLEHRLKGSY